MSNTTEFAKESFMALPGWAKGVLVVGSLVGGFFAVKAIIKTVSDVKAEKPQREEDRGWNQEFDQLNSNASTKAKLTKAQMQSIANKFETQMDGYGTRDADMIKTFWQIQNNADFAGVQAAFGIRTIEAGRGIGWLAGDFRGTLVQCIQEEADTKTINSINGYLKNKGIKYRI